MVKYCHNASIGLSTEVSNSQRIVEEKDVCPGKSPIKTLSTALALAFSLQLIGTCVMRAQESALLTRPGSGWVVAQSSNVLPADSLGADDLLEITVSYCPELTRNFRVSSDGSLSLPLLQKKLKVVGLTPTQTAYLLQQELNDEHILTEATVNISVLEYRSRPVSVVGAVAHPLTFQATGQTTLLEAIAKAGGLASNAGGDVLVITKGSPIDGKNVIQTISVRDLMSASDSRLNLKLQGNEEIRVPEVSKIFVAGNVRHPGMFPMQSDVETTVVKALALSSGLAEYNSNTAFIYRHRKSGSERDEIPVQLGRIMSHKSPDVALMPDDILFVPGSDGKRITSRILNQLAGFGQAAAVGVLVYK